MHMCLRNEFRKHHFLRASKTTSELCVNVIINKDMRNCHKPGSLNYVDKKCIYVDDQVDDNAVISPGNTCRFCST